MAMAEDTVAQDFPDLTNAYRGELLAHCYRMLGSVHDAEDLVQETYLRAWRSFDTFEGRSSMRTWLYRIATNVCLTALEGRSRRPLPTGLGAPSADPVGELVQQPEVPWLEPIPDSVIGDGATDPATVVTGRESIRLAFVAALQHLPPRQRAVLILRDVLRWRAAEVAELLDTTTVAVNSTLQRARAQIERLAPSEQDVVEPLAPDQRELLERYVAAFESYDVAAIVELFTKDATWEMPPFTGWYQGAQNIGRLISTQCPAQRAGDMLLVPTRANGQPAFGLYMRGEDGVHRAFQLHTLGITGSTSGWGVAHVAAFFDVGLFARFGLPETHPAPPLPQRG
jgi:RNA polymerase sigma-70 factor (ECF subfamily)